MNNPNTLVCDESEASAQQCVALRRNMLRLTAGGWAWSRTITIRLDGKLVVRLAVARDCELSHYDYTLEPTYAVQFIDVGGSALRTLKVKTATRDFLMRVTEGWMKSPMFEFENVDGTSLVSIDRTLQSACWRNGFLSSAKGDMQISAGTVYISQALPIELGIAMMLYWGSRAA